MGQAIQHILVTTDLSEESTRAFPTAVQFAAALGARITVPAGDDRVDDAPRLFDLVGAREQRAVAEHRIEQQPLVGVGGLAAEGRAVAEVHAHVADPHVGAGHLGAEAQRHPSSGWMRSSSTFGSSGLPPSNSRCGGCLKWIATSVTRRGRRLPERRKNGVRAQRQLSTCRRTAA
jgi:hypothetical protein